MNLLVAIMSEAYAAFSDDANKESSTYKALCAMMDEHDFLFTPEEEFRGARYILHIGANNPEIPDSIDEKKVAQVDTEFTRRLAINEHRQGRMISDLEEKQNVELARQEDI
jgi:hypothetical protein